MFTNVQASCMALWYVRIKHCLIQKGCGGLLLDKKTFAQLIGYNYLMKCHRLYPIANFKNSSPDILKMANILRYGVRYGKVCLGGNNLIECLQRFVLGGLVLGKNCTGNNSTGNNGIGNRGTNG